MATTIAALRRGNFFGNDADIPEAYKSVSQNLESLERKVSEKIKGNQTAIEKGKGVVEVLSALGSTFGKQETVTIEGGAALGSLFSEMSRTFKLFEMFYANFTALMSSDVESVLEKYLCVEMEAVRYQRKKLDKASAALDNATQKLNHVRAQQAKPGAKIDGSKVSEAEQEHNRAKQNHENAKRDTAAAVQDAHDGCFIYAVQSMLGFFDAAQDFFSRGSQSFTEARVRLEPFRQQHKERRTTFVGPQKNLRENDTVKSGSLEKLAEKGKSWHQRWAMLKFRTVYLFEKTDLKTLKTVIRLRGCSVSESSSTPAKKGFLVVIKRSDREWVLSAKTKQEQDAWISAIVSCVPQGGTAAQQTSPPTSPRDRERAPSSPPIPSTLSPVGSFIGGRSPAVTAVTDMTASRASGSGSGTKAPPEPLRDAFRHLLVDERGYVQILNTIVTMYIQPLREATTLGEDYSRSDETAIFSTIEMIWYQHIDLLTEMQAMMDQWSTDRNMGILILGRLCGSGLELYSRYVTNFPAALIKLEKLKHASRNFDALIKRSQSVSNEGEELEVLLSYPLNRVLQYRRFAEQVANMLGPVEPMTSTLSGATLALQQIVDAVSESNRQSEEIATLISWSKKLEHDAIVAPDRRFVTEGSGALLLDGIKTDVLLFLFSDQIIWSRKLGLIGRLKDKYKVEGKIMLQKSQLRDVDAFSLAIVDAQNKQYQLTLPSMAEKEEWKRRLTEIAQQILNARSVFGVPLQQLMSSARQKSHDVPIFVEKALAFLSQPSSLEAEGLFRLSGQQTTIDSIKESLDSGKDIDFSNTTDVHIVTGLLKLWFRELPEPVFTWALYDTFITAAGGQNDNRPLQQKLDGLRAALNQLPVHNKCLVQALFKFLRMVADRSTVNRMAPKNLAIVFGPNLLGKKATAASSSALLNDMNEAYEVVILLIENYDAVFSDIERERMANQVAARKAEEEQRALQVAQREQYLHSLPTKSDVPRPKLAEEDVFMPGEIVKDGWLEKKGKNRRNWKTRFFKLRYKFLNYYASPLDEVPLGRIKLLASCQVGLSSYKPFCVVITTPEREFLVAARSEEERQEWLQAIMSCVEGYDVMVGTRLQLSNSGSGATQVARSQAAAARTRTDTPPIGSAAAPTPAPSATPAAGASMISNPAFAEKEVVNPAFTVTKPPYTAELLSRKAQSSYVPSTPPPPENVSGSMLRKMSDVLPRAAVPVNDEESSPPGANNPSPNPNPNTIAPRPPQSKSHRVAGRWDGSPSTGPLPMPNMAPPAPPVQRLDPAAFGPAPPAPTSPPANNPTATLEKKPLPTVPNKSLPAVPKGAGAGTTKRNSQSLDGFKM